VPTYSYACTECGDRFDAVQAFSDSALTTCAKCDGRLRKLFGNVGVVFKGSGFYRNDSRESAKASAKTSASSSNGSGVSSESTSSSSSASSGSIRSLSLPACRTRASSASTSFAAPAVSNRATGNSAERTSGTAAEASSRQATHAPVGRLGYREGPGTARIVSGGGG